MRSKPFEKPVRVWVGLGPPRQLNTVADTYQCAVEWCGKAVAQLTTQRSEGS